MSRPDAALNAARKRDAARNLATALPWASGYFVVIAIAHLVMLGPDLALPMSAIAALSAVAIGATALAARRRTAAIVARAHRLWFWAGAIVLANSAALTILQDNPLQSTNIVLVVLGAGLVYRSRWAIALTAGLAFGALGVAARLSAGGDWAHFAFALASACALSAAVFAARDQALIELVNLRAAGRTQGEVLREAAATAQESERRYRALATLTPDPILVIKRGKICFSNAAANTLLGAGRSLEGTRLRALVHDEDWPKTVAWRPEMSLLQGRARTLSGKSIPVEAHIATVEIGGAPAVFVVARDERPRHTTERLKAEFISIVSHELRTPLTAILGASTLIAENADDLAPARVTSLSQMIHRNAQRLQAQIDDLLDVQRLETGALTLTREEVRLVDLLAPIADATSGATPVEWTAPSDLCVRGDPERLAQAIRALVDNAVKFAPRGLPVELHASRTADEVLIAISDRGPGVPASKSLEVFGFFQQGSTGNNRAHGGAGLGLAIARGIVEHHGGHIHLTGREGGGTTFTVALPAG